MDDSMICGLTLRETIRSKYGSIHRLAEHLGWQENKLYRILRREQSASVPDFYKLRQALGAEAQVDSESLLYFLAT